MALYEKRSLTTKVIKKICTFVTWFAQRDAEQSTATFGQLMNEAATAATQPTTEQPLIDTLPETFNVAELIVAQRKKGRETDPRQVIYRWKKIGYIKKNDNGTFTKIKK